MRIIGIDPGLHITGYGILDTQQRNIQLVEAGCIRTNPKHRLEARLKIIFDELNSIVDEFHPEQFSVENLYSHYKNPQTAIIMGHARGVIYLVASTHDIPVTEYSATRIKKSLTGYGRASKIQVQKMVQNALGLVKPPEPVDVTDSLAAAMCHANVIKHQAGLY